MESDDPKHYKKQTQTWDAIISQLSDQEVVGYLKGSAAKHLFRSGEKHGGGLSSTIMDIKKAKKYIEKLLEFLIQSKMIETPDCCFLLTPLPKLLINPMIEIFYISCHAMNGL